MLRTARSRSRYTLNVLMLSSLSSVQSRFGSVQLGSGGGLALRDRCSEL